MKRRTFLERAGASALLLGLHGDGRKPPRPPLVPVPIPPGTTAEELFAFQPSEVKFRLEDMMGMLSDRAHEGWHLDAYPDPTHKNIALIGAGFNLSNAQEITHAPVDRADPYQHNHKVRIEPPAEVLWKAAGLQKNRMDAVLDRFEERMKTLHGNRYAFQLLEPLGGKDITDEEATKLLYVSTRQAVHNAMAYAQDFGNMSASQQMGMAHLVYQMGSRLEGFSHFLADVNDTSYRAAASPEAEARHWRAAQSELIDSDWFRKHTSRAIRVVAMFDPQFDLKAPDAAEDRVRALAHEMEQKKGFADRGSVQPGASDRGRQ